MGPLRIMTRVASTTVSVGRKAAARSTIAGWISWCRRPRLPPISPMWFLMPQVRWESEWCLTTGTLISRSASKRTDSTSQLARIEPPSVVHSKPEAPGSTRSPPAAVTAARMPERSATLWAS